MNYPSRFQRWLRRTFTLYLGAKIALAVLVLAVSAAAITVAPTNYQAEMGSAFNVSNNILVGDKGFSKPAAGTAATGTCPSGNVTFGASPGSANNAIIAGDIVYDAQVNATALTPLFSCFTVSITLPIGGSQTTKSLTIASGAAVAAGQTIDCKLDIGTSTLPVSPYSFKVVVQ